MLSKEVSSTIFKVFGMTRPGIELRSPRPLANTLPTRSMSLNEQLTHNCMISNQNDNKPWQKIESLIKGTLIGNYHSDLRGPEKNGNEGLLHIPQTPRLEPQHQMQDTKWFQVLLFNTNKCI